MVENEIIFFSLILELVQSCSGTVLTRTVLLVESDFRLTKPWSFSIPIFFWNGKSFFGTESFPFQFFFGMEKLQSFERESPRTWTKYADFTSNFVSTYLKNLLFLKKELRQSRVWTHDDLGESNLHDALTEWAIMTWMKK